MTGGPPGASDGSNSARAAAPLPALPDNFNFSGASVFVVSRHGALLGRVGNIWHDFGGRRQEGETPHATAFREMHEEIRGRRERG